MKLKCFLLLPMLFSVATPTATHGEEKTKFYDPVEKQLEGWTLAVDPQLLEEKNKEVADRAFEALANHLQRVKYIVPKDRLAQLQKLPIWIDLNNPKFFEFPRTPLPTFPSILGTPRVRTTTSKYRLPGSG